MLLGESVKHREFQNSTKIQENYKFSLKTGRIQGKFSLTSFYSPKISELLNLCKKKKKMLVNMHVIFLQIRGKITYFFFLAKINSSKILGR